MTLLAKLWKDRRGNVLVIVAGAMPLIIGAAGLASDTIQWTLWKRQLQRAADSAAIAGVYTVSKTGGNTDAAALAAVTKDLGLNLHTAMALKATPTVTRLGTSGQMSNRVSVALQIQKTLPFSSIFMRVAPTIVASATAANVPDGGEYCVVGLDRRSTVTGITISGSTNLNMGSCSLLANSSHPTLAASNGSNGGGGSGSSVVAASLAAAGGVNYSNQWTVGSYNPYSVPLDDPFASKQSLIPTALTTAGGCTKTGVTIGGNGTVDRTTADTAGQVVCMSGDQTIQGNVTLGPATYVINAGNLRMTQTGASLTCDGCTIILTNVTNPANTGTVFLNGGSISMKPPRSTTTTNAFGVTTTTTIGNQNWAGFTFYQDPRATDSGSTAQNKIAGNNSTSVQGVVYFGNQSLEYVGGGNLTAVCLQLLAKRITFSGSSKITAGSACAGFGMSSVGGTRRVRLVA